MRPRGGVVSCLAGPCSFVILSAAKNLILGFVAENANSGPLAVRPAWLAALIPSAEPKPPAPFNQEMAPAKVASKNPPVQKLNRSANWRVLGSAAAVTCRKVGNGLAG